jgi:hypothetical protein
MFTSNCVLRIYYKFCSLLKSYPRGLHHVYIPLPHIYHLLIWIQKDLFLCLSTVKYFFSDLSVEGLYRVSGQSSEIIELKEKFNEGMPWSTEYDVWNETDVRYICLGEAVDLSQYQDLNIITGVIKLYLRELPIPLITYDTYKEIIKATGGVFELIASKTTRTLFLQLPWVT